MGNKESFLSDWRPHISSIASTFNDGFKKELKANLEQPTEIFLHMLCRKIDIKKQLYFAYDPKNDLKAVSDEKLDEIGWEVVLYLLSHYLLNNTHNVAISYKALNTLLKAKEIFPQNLQENLFITKLYSNIIPEWL